MKAYKTIISALLCLVIFAGLCACSKGDSEGEFAVELKTAGGFLIEDAKIAVFADKALGDIVNVGKTDDGGRVVFSAEEKVLYAVIQEGVSKGYNVKKSYKLSRGSNTITLETELIKDMELSDFSPSLGDVMLDFTLTDVDGKTHTLSKLLKDKKAIVLNFWYLGCEPCRMEFPYLQKAYEAYDSEIEVLAVNPYDGTESDISEYKTSNSLSFPMIKGEKDWQLAMHLMSYPTTIIIDRFGTIAMVHSGSIAEEGIFEGVFEYFSADDYKQCTVRNITDITQKN